MDEEGEKPAEGVQPNDDGFLFFFGVLLRNLQQQVIRPALKRERRKAITTLS